MLQKADSVLLKLFQIVLPYIISRNAEGSALSFFLSGFRKKKYSRLVLFRFV